MKAIQVRYVGATPSKPSNRLKAFVEGGYVYADANGMHELDEIQAEKMARLLMSNLKWEDVELTGSGILPNGDWVFTLRSKS